MAIGAIKLPTINPKFWMCGDHWNSIQARFLIEPRMSGLGVRRGKAAFFSGCKFHPAIAPAGSNRSSHGGDEMAEAFGIACHELVSLDFRCGSNPEVSRGHGNVCSWADTVAKLRLRKNRATLIRRHTLLSKNESLHP